MQGSGSTHSHVYSDRVVNNNQIFGVNSNQNAFPYNTISRIMTNYNNRTDTSSSAGAHSHSSSFNSGSSNYLHYHNFNAGINNTTDTGGSHIHNLNTVGNNTNSTINIVPPYYTLRFIKKN